MHRTSIIVLVVGGLLTGCTASRESSSTTAPARDAAASTIETPATSLETPATSSGHASPSNPETVPAADSATTTSVAPDAADTEQDVPIDTPIAPAALAFSLPDGFEYPEGIAVDPVSGRAYVTSTPTGAVAVAEPGADTATVWLPAGTDGRTLTFGIEFGVDSVWLVSPPAIWEYGVDGDLRGHHVAPDGGFLNDLAITAQGIFVTDSTEPVLWFLPAGSSAEEPLKPLDFSMTEDVMGGSFQLNGIEALEDGTLVAVHFSNGQLFHIDPRSPNGRTITGIDLGGYLLTVGDGMRARGDVLWVTRGAASDTVDRVALCPSHDCGKVTAGLPDPALSFPTDIELRGDQLLVVNSQFDNGGGLGDGIPSKPFTVSAIPVFGR